MPSPPPPPSPGVVHGVRPLRGRHGGNDAAGGGQFSAARAPEQQASSSRGRCRGPHVSPACRIHTCRRRSAATPPSPLKRPCSASPLRALQQVLALADYQRQLHVVYLANDVLFKGLALRAAGAGPEAGAHGRGVQRRGLPPAQLIVGLRPSSPAALRAPCHHPSHRLVLPVPSCAAPQMASRRPSSPAWAACCARPL